MPITADSFANCIAANVRKQSRAGKPEIESAIFDGKSSGHLDLDADYRWQCAKPLALRDIATRLFAEFPRLKQIKVEFAGPNGQKSGRLTPQQPRFAW